MWFDCFYLFQFTGEADHKKLFKMFNSFFSALSIFLILITHDIILLNEEILILICFVLFIWIGLNKFSKFTKNYLTEYTIKIEEPIKTSLSQMFYLLKKTTILNLKFKNLVVIFNDLKTHFSILFALMLKTLPTFYKGTQFLFYPKRLLLIERLEKQTIKLVILFITKKLNKIILIKQFYLKFPAIHFLCFYKIALRESLVRINQYK